MVGKKNGLKPTEQVPGGKLGHFAIAGADQQWFWAAATIDGDTVVVQSANVPQPVAVRYGFSMNAAKANLYNREGIPASPFRTDRWTGPSEDLKWNPAGNTLPAKSNFGSATTILSRNKRDRVVKIFWVEYGGGLKLYGQIQPGGSRKQGTFANPSWLVTDDQDHPLGYFRTTAKVGRAVIPSQ